MTNTKKQGIGEALIIVAFVVSVLKNMIDLSVVFVKIPYITDFLLLIFILCIGAKLLLQKYSFPGLIGIAILGAILLYSGISIKYYSLFYSFLIIICMQNVSIQKTLIASIIAKATFLIVHVILYVVTYLVAFDTITFFYRNGIKRHAFLMGHPNVFTAYLAWTSLEIIYVWRDKIRYWQLAVIWLVNVFFYQFTNTNSGTLIISLVIPLFILVRKEHSLLDKIIYGMARYGYLILSIFFAYLAAVYLNLTGWALDLWLQLNDAMTGRLMYGAYTYDMFGTTFIGRFNYFPEKTYWDGQWLDTIYFDNSYYSYFFQIGILYLIIVILAFIFIGRYTTKVEQLMLIALALYGIMEGYVVNIFICFPLIFIGKYIFDKNRSSNRRKKQEESSLWNIKSAL